MPEQWLTYRQLGELWNTSPEAARVRCRRANYQRRTNESGIAEVLVDLDAFVTQPNRSVQRRVNWTAVVPYDAEQDVSNEVALRSIIELEAEVAALSDTLSKAEEEMETIRRYLVAERDQVSHLMTLLLRSQKQKGKGRGIFGFLLFWRRSPRKDRLSTVHETTSPPDRQRSGSVAGADTLHFTPYAMPDSPHQTRTRDHN